MGRYAFFNTGLEYKFKFGIQPSCDIREFGGMSYIGIDEDTLIHKWKKIDIDLIKSLLDDEYPIEGLNWSDFKNDLNGTYNLKYHLDSLNTENIYVLGYIIYHQLLYTDELVVEYEL